VNYENNNFTIIRMLISGSLSSSQLTFASLTCLVYKTNTISYCKDYEMSWKLKERLFHPGFKSHTYEAKGILEPLVDGPNHHQYCHDI
jgi:hypothetical protein